ncbi:SMP-30/gluconolactonase/LRE family protein [Ferrimonas balearica]|uniref:SMP-30/gluconolactonase/LRE family protein n=1 Tax=Ferrimonas balearica TaxID=44012 RepID=UPI001C578E63|nr:SMP-30/gluconolactonase/LRE family protein [Ferrimonas balearica]MBW3138700.1 SMP-30/gluconolactonase/LRE family protein [Ferrimonas balearica]MBY6223697.1 SMP-30/gluconolactonase/LRE family protein [Ferrimonas balearica]
MKVPIWLLSVLVAVMAYLALWPVPMSAQRWGPVDEVNADRLPGPEPLDSGLTTLPLPQSQGPEDVAVSPDGQITTGLADGTLWQWSEGAGWQMLGHTGGRPLGLDYSSDGTLYIADAIKGLLRWQTDGTAQTLLAGDELGPFGFVDDLAVDPRGQIYFTDASRRFPAQRFGVADGSVRDLLAHSQSGSLYRFDPASGQLDTLMTGLSFANGVTLSHDGNSVLVCETGRYRIWRHQISGGQAGQSSIWIDGLPGFPDNISRAENGGYWVGLVAPRDGLLDALAPYPALRDVIQRLPAALRPAAKRHGQLLWLNENGAIGRHFDDPKGTFAFITGAEHAGNRVYLTSLHEPALAILPAP